MKHSLYFLIIITLLFAGCRQKAQSNFLSESSAQTEESNPSLEEYAEEAVITGKVLNRDFYPQEKELTLIIPLFFGFTHTNGIYNQIIRREFAAQLF
jgi:hypothetical protein